MNTRILCAYDGSAAAEKAFDFALTMASAFKSELRVLAVAQPPEPPRMSRPKRCSSRPRTTSRGNSRRFARRRLRPE